MDPNLEQAKGKVEQAAGDLTGNDDLKSDGKADEMAGKAKEFASDAADKVSDVADDVVDKVKGIFKKD